MHGLTKKIPIPIDNPTTTMLYCIYNKGKRENKKMVAQAELTAYETMPNKTTFGTWINALAYSVNAMVHVNYKYRKLAVDVDYEQHVAYEIADARHATITITVWGVGDITANIAYDTNAKRPLVFEIGNTTRSFRDAVNYEYQMSETFKTQLNGLMAEMITAVFAKNEAK